MPRMWECKNVKIRTVIMRIPSLYLLDEPFVLLSPCYYLPTFFLLSCYILPSGFLEHTLNVASSYLGCTLDVPSPYLGRTLPLFCIYQKNKSIINCSLLHHDVQPNLQFGWEKSREFVARTPFACYRRDARIPTAEKVVMLCITFCRFATMGVTNSRFLMLPNSEIRQNQLCFA